MRVDLAVEAEPGILYRILVDPVALSRWLDLPSVTTGEDPFHVFELEDWQGASPWKVRGTLMEKVPGSRLLVEIESARKGSAGWFSFTLHETGSGSLLVIEGEGESAERVGEVFSLAGQSHRLAEILNDRPGPSRGWWTLTK